MDRSFLEFAYSGWWILLIIGLSAGLSFVLYAKKNVPWNNLQNGTLFLIRFLAIFLTLLLFLSPSIRIVDNRVEKPVIAFALDNSQSVASRGLSPAETIASIDQITERLEENGISVETVTFSDSTDFSASTTNLSQLIRKAEEKVEGRNSVALLMASDGIYNRGSSPLYHNFFNPVFTLGLGDSIPPKDVSITRVLYNKVSYKDNQTPVRIEVRQSGYQGDLVSLQLLENDQVIAEKSSTLVSPIIEEEFLIESSNEGLRHLVARVVPLSGESSLMNNQSDIFMEVIDGRQKILIVADAPHPDIKAIRNTLELTGNYETFVYVPQIHDEKPTDIFDVVIYHGAFTSGVNYEPKENPGRFYILSNESSLTTLNKVLPFINIERRGSQPDQVVGSLNPNFSKFKMDEVEVFEEYPPIEVPFGNYEISGPVEVLMYQKLGSVTTSNPLMVVFDDGTEKSTVLLGQNIWKWKLQEAALNEQAEQFDKLITKTIQFLSVKNDKKQFRFNPRRTNFTDSEPALFDAEVYNDIYERTYQNTISIVLRDEGGNTSEFEFTDTEFNSTFRSTILSAGIYQYEATVTVGEKEMRDQGEFAVQNINQEILNLTADHRMLRNLSAKTNGAYASINEAEFLVDEIIAREFKSLIKSEERLIPLFNAWWWYLLIFLLFSGEWILRKYWGGY